MAMTALERDIDVIQDDPQTSAFLAALTELSAQHGIAIGGSPVLFVMEWEDSALTYQADSESRLSLE